MANVFLNAWQVNLSIFAIFGLVSCNSENQGGNDVEYTIEFNSNGGSEVADILVEQGEGVKQPNDPVKEGFKFKGW